jgi:hypothetical protein
MHLCVAVGIALSAPASYAQDPDGPPELVRITLVDGTFHEGRITAESPSEIVLETLGGVRITIPRSQIASIEPIAPGARRLTKDPNQTRLLFSPTARSLESGQGYIALYEIFFPFVAVGVGNVATLAGGLSLLPGVSEQLLYVAPKITAVSSGNTSIAVGGFAATLTGSGGYGGIVYGLATHGASDAAVTGGVGFLFGEGEFVSTPIILLGGEYQLSNSVKLLSENYFIPEVDSGLLVSVGVRFIGDSVSGDFGLFTSPAALGESGFPFIPWLGFSYAFGRD